MTAVVVFGRSEPLFRRSAVANYRNLDVEKKVGCLEAIHPEGNPFMNRRILPLLGLSIALLPSFGTAHAQGDKKPALKPEVKELLTKCTAAYSKLKSYHQVTVMKVEGATPMGDVNRETRYILALERPAKFCFKSEGAATVACVSDGTTFINFNGREYTKGKAPASYKG